VSAYVDGLYLIEEWAHAQASALVEEGGDVRAALAAPVTGGGWIVIYEADEPLADWHRRLAWDGTHDRWGGVSVELSEWEERRQRRT
jgi:hypothetical protein